MWQIFSDVRGKSSQILWQIFTDFRGKFSQILWQIFTDFRGKSSQIFAENLRRWYFLHLHVILNLLIETVGKHGDRSEEETREFVGSSQQSLDLLLGDGEPGAFTREWEAKFTR
jgi:hypothetical protein